MACNCGKNKQRREDIYPPEQQQPDTINANPTPAAPSQ